MNAACSSTNSVASRTLYITCWLLFLVVHAASIAVCAGTIAVNRYLQDNDRGVILSFLGGSPIYFLEPVVFANALLLTGHLFCLLKMLLFSAYHRQLLFSAPPKSTTRDQAASSRAAVPGKRSWTPRSLLSCLHTHFGRKGSFGIEGAHYDEFYTAVEVVSVTVRVFQAYKVSTWISRLWINRLVALFAILSCVSTPLLRLWILPALRLKKRVALLVADSAFDFVTSMWIPTAIALPYVLAYDPALSDFPLINYYHDTWFVQAVFENRQAFAVSWLDFFAKNYPKFSYLFAMVLVKTCLAEECERRASTSSASSKAQQRSLGLLFKKRSTAVAPTGALIPFAANLTRMPSMTEFTALAKHSWRQRVVSKKYWIQNGFFLVSGVAVLVIHAHTMMARTWRERGSNADASDCLLEMHPWFASSQQHCAVVEIRCGLDPVSEGDADDLDAFLADMEPTAVKGLIISSCPRLQMPPTIARVNNLRLIKIYNCTIDHWDDTATLTGALHSHMQLVYIVNSNMSEVPRGLLSDDFPPMLSDIEFSGTNLTHLPAEVSVKWSPLYFFVLERSPGVAEFPAPLAQLQLSFISLQSNSISHIPDDLLATQALWMLTLANNPLQRLPERIGDVARLYMLDVRHTLVGELPSWLKTHSDLAVEYTWGTNGTSPEVVAAVRADGTLLCSGDTLSVLTSDIVSPHFQLNCTDDPADPLYLYPLEAEIRWRSHEQG